MENQSIFTGWVETSRHRFEWVDAFLWGAYEKHGDSFLFVGYVKCEWDTPEALTRELWCLQEGDRL